MTHLYLTQNKKPEKVGTPVQITLLWFVKLLAPIQLKICLVFSFLFLFDLNDLSTSVCRSRRARLPDVFKTGQAVQLRVKACTD